MSFNTKWIGFEWMTMQYNILQSKFKFNQRKRKNNKRHTVLFSSFRWFDNSRKSTNTPQHSILSFSLWPCVNWLCYGCLWLNSVPKPQRTMNRIKIIIINKRWSAWCISNTIHSLALAHAVHGLTQIHTSEMRIHNISKQQQIYSFFIVRVNCQNIFIFCRIAISYALNLCAHNTT